MNAAKRSLELDQSPTASEYEEQHVHEVYQTIAPHFSSTRYKPWPIVTKFLEDLTPGSVGVDVGCGNGKYMAVRDDIYIVGSDRSSALVQIARRYNSHDTIVADTLCLPHGPRRFDFAICIAVVHHLSTRERRVAAIRSVFGCLERCRSSPGSSTVGQPKQALFFVWALEQKLSRRGWEEGQEQDVMVPWVSRKDQIANNVPKNSLETREDGVHTYLRYYHLYQAGELEADITSAGGTVLSQGYERDNWWAIAEPT